MTTPAIETYGYQGRLPNTVTKPNEMGRDQFLTLLLAQLRHQDPLKPMEDREFIAQLAQFNILEQMQQMNEGLLAMMYMDQFTQASALVGRVVDAYAPDGDQTISGVVTEVRFDRGIAELVVGEHRIALQDVVSVR